MKSFSRRKFIFLSANGAIAAPLLTKRLMYPKPGMPDLAGQKEDPVFRFLQINDLHMQSNNTRYRPKTGPTYKNANDRALWLIEALNSNFFPSLDFILGIGDMVYGESIEGITYDLDFFNQHFLSHLKIPFYPVIGNHENRQQEGNSEFEGPYTQLYGKERLNYSFVHKGIHFVMLNNSGTWNISDQAIPEHRRDVLIKMLSEEPALPKLVCCHVPFVPVREKKVLAETFGFTSYYMKEPEPVDLVEKNDKVLAVLTGHLHLSGVVKVNGVYHISVSGLASYPHDMALYSVYRNRIEAELVRVPSDLLEPSTNIHGASRFSRDYTDATHPDYTTYIMGNESERRFTIPLKKS